MIKKNYTQSELYNLLKNNPLGTAVHIGDLADLEGKDYLFFDQLNDNLIGSDNGGCYLNNVQFTVCCKSYDDRKTLVDFLKQYFSGTVTYEHSTRDDYYLARLKTGLFIYE